jgi:hypothetical protein
MNYLQLKKLCPAFSGLTGESRRKELDRPIKSGDDILYERCRTAHGGFFLSNASFVEE